MSNNDEYKGYKGAALKTLQRYHPADLVQDLQKSCPEDTIFFAYMGNIMAWATRYMTFTVPYCCNMAMGFGSMGYAVAAPVGAKLARPDRTMVAMVGDGSFQMNGFEVATAVNYNIPVVWVVFNNSMLGMVYHGRRLFKNIIPDGLTPHFKQVDFAQVAEGLGARGIRVEKPEEITPEFMADILREGQPTVIDVLKGRVRRSKKLSVKVPAGVGAGDRIRLGGEGEAGRNGGPHGDLYVEIAVREHPIFERDGAHLSCEVPVSFATAALGGSVEVPTLDGQAAVKIPAGTQSGRVFRLRDKGIKPVRGGATGDLFCRVVVETPVELNAQQKDLLRKFESALAADGRSHNPRQSSWFEGVRQCFMRSGH